MAERSEGLVFAENFGDGADRRRRREEEASISRMRQVSCRQALIMEFLF